MVHASAVMQKFSPLVWLFVVSLAIRGFVMATANDDLRLDTDAYSRLAVNWANCGTYGHESNDGHVTPTAYRPPLYPWLLSWFVFNHRLSIVGVAVFHGLLGIATIVLTYLIGLRLGLKRAWIAGLIVALDPILIRQSQLVMTETLATFLAVLSWWVWLVVYPFQARETCTVVQRRPMQWMALVGFGVVMGLSILARPTAAPWAAMCLVGMLRIGCQCWKRRINDCVLVGIVVVSVLIPWTIRNVATFGHPIWATTHGGYTLLLANNRSLYDHLSQSGVHGLWQSRAWDTRDFDEAWLQRHLSQTPSQPLDEVADDRLAYQSALDTMRGQPRMFLLSCFHRVAWLWALWPRSDSISMSVIAIGMWYAIEFLGAIIGIAAVVRSGRYRAWLVSFALLLSLTAVHSVYWSNMRMRSPAIPVVALLSVVGLNAVLGRARSSP